MGREYSIHHGFSFQCIERYVFLRCGHFCLSLFCLFLWMQVCLFLFPTVPVIRSPVHSMARCRLVPMILDGFKIILFIYVCESCDSFHLNKWKGIGPIYRETEGPANTLKSLSACSRWCMEKPSCVLLSWTPGSCWQVGLCGTLNVTGTVYDIKKKPIGWYMICFRDKYTVIALLWVVIETNQNN